MVNESKPVLLQDYDSRQTGVHPLHLLNTMKSLEINRDDILCLGTQTNHDYATINPIYSQRISEMLNSSSDIYTQIKRPISLSPSAHSAFRPLHSPFEDEP
ncbi:hypothetical protein Ciccas_001251 [Cichlidogyrus casuarinus]|uniref:Uncharacterized protein n=1 Tax=Cichlidogyrus casuarinus TaxID=1844966 RepID=A0ABD2QLQ1_9PLAT